MYKRLLYTLIMYLGTPVILYRLASRGLRYHDYFSRWRERFGFFADPGLHDSIWVHAVSVGEVNAAVPLIEALMARYPERPCVVTTITPTGSERVRRLFGDRVFHVYLPYDLPASVRRFLDRVRPRLGVIMETEIWPNLYFACHVRGLPLIVANARLSARSLRSYGPVRSLAGDAIRSATRVAAQSHADARRFETLGADPARISITGNLKFDMSVPTQLLIGGRDMRRTWGADRPVWIAASTHEGEELAVFQAHLEVLRRLPDALLLIAPRHPERFHAVAQAGISLGFRVATRSADGLPRASTQCFIVDSMGELMRFYASVDVAFVGGSMVAVGGHNVLEPAALAKPVVVGPYTFNFSEITDTLVAAGGARQLDEPAQLGAVVAGLLGDAAIREPMGIKACAVFDGERGAVSRTMALVDGIVQDETGADRDPGPEPAAARPGEQ